MCVCMCAVIVIIENKTWVEKQPYKTNVLINAGFSISVFCGSVCLFIVWVVWDQLESVT